MPITRNGKLLTRNGKMATSLDCCCCCCEEGGGGESCCQLDDDVIVGNKSGGDCDSEFWGMTLHGPAPGPWVGSQFAGCGTLTLEMTIGYPTYEFVLYLDGVEVARRNVPPNLTPVGGQVMCSSYFGDVTLTLPGGDGCCAGTKNITVLGPWSVPC